jgi:hypothetical protein
LEKQVLEVVGRIQRFTENEEIKPKNRTNHN